jgi:hypothetical protein
MMKLVPPVLIVAMAAISGTGALAEDIPRFDINFFCRQNVASTAQVASCRRAEEGKRGALQLGWESFPKQRKHFCVQSVAFRPRAERSYVQLAACLQEQVTS